MSKAIDCLQMDLARARAAKTDALEDLDEAQSSLSAAQARITSADATITDISTAIVTLGGTVEG